MKLAILMMMCGAASAVNMRLRPNMPTDAFLEMNMFAATGTAGGITPGCHQNGDMTCPDAANKCVHEICKPSFCLGECIQHVHCLESGNRDGDCSGVPAGCETDCNGWAPRRQCGYRQSWRSFLCSRVNMRK